MANLVDIEYFVRYRIKREYQENTVMKINYACGSADHGIARRHFLGSMAATGAGIMAGGLGVFQTRQLLRSYARIKNALSFSTCMAG